MVLSRFVLAGVGLGLAWCVGASLPSTAVAQNKKKPEPPKVNLPIREAGPPVRVIGVDAKRKNEALVSARMIDTMIEKALQSHSQQPNEAASDEVFVRRAYLTLAGTIPTAAQAESFVRRSTSGKQEGLVDQLLGSPAHASHMYNYWADILRLIDRESGNNHLLPYREWVKDALRQNMPYDDFVRTMLTAEGHIWDNPAAGYSLRDTGMPLDNLNNTVRIFLGTQIGCAQCHDHPFDRWTQKEFYELAAFTAGVQFRKSSNPMVDQMMVREDRDRPNKKGPEVERLYDRVDFGSPEGSAARALQQSNRHSVWEDTKRTLRFPKDYAYDNAKPNDVAKRAVLFGTMPVAAKGVSGRQAFADWVCSKENPRFARTIANRLWKQAFGVGLIEPVDDMKDDTVASIPELMTFLESELIRLDFDLREFMRIIYYTKTFQRQATYADLAPDEPYYFPGPLVRRMSAEQVWDSLLTLTLPNPHQYTFDYSEELMQVVNLEGTESVDELLARSQTYRDFNNKLGKERAKTRYKGLELLPASELPQPLPPEHFIRQFGQSDRQQIGDSHTDGTVPQLLAMFNGPVTHMMLERGSVIFNTVVEEKDVGRQVDQMFLSLLGRKPTPAEKKMGLEEMRRAGAAGYGNVIWALLNTREFLFVQ